MKTFRDRVAVVTGAGSGIGRAVSLELARRGTHLALVDLDAEGLRETARLAEEQGVGVTTHQIDVADRARMEAFPAEVIEAHGQVDIVVNNAGVTVAHTVAAMDMDDFEWIMGINFWGMVYGTRFFLPHLLERDEAHIVNLSSLFGLIGVPGQSSYCATKFAIRGFTESLRAELRGMPVGITSVHPGGVDTRIAANARFRNSLNEEVSSAEDLASRFKNAARTTPEQAGRLIVRAIERNRPRLVVGNDAKIMDRLQRWMPVRYVPVIDWIIRRM